MSDPPTTLAKCPSCPGETCRDWCFVPKNTICEKCKRVPGEKIKIPPRTTKGMFGGR